jgi:UDP-MurNAc hydroxylase
MTNEVGGPRIQFLNHSCVLVSDGSTSVLCDPWFKGAVFDNGWRLLHENSHDINQIACDYIWVSHEHPDHFSIPTLKDLKGKKCFLYQTTKDKKVLAYLQSKGHEVLELAAQKETAIGTLKCTLFTCDGYDSAMLFRFADGSTFLNVNDARVELGGVLETIEKAASTVDTIAVQFSYANWAGNAGDSEIPKDQHEAVADRVIHLRKALKPKQTILFASYVYFSHADNFYWNDHFWLKQVVAKLNADNIGKAIVPLPNQTIPVVPAAAADYAVSNQQAIAFWEGKHREAAPKDLDKEVIQLPALRENYSAFFDELWKKNDLALASNAGKPFPLKVCVTDLAKVVEIGLFDKNFAELPTKDYDIQVSSNTFQFLLKNAFGRGTVSINSKISFNYPTAYKFFVFFFIFYANNIGKYFKEGGLSWAALTSLRNVAALQSIFKFHPDASANFAACMKEFLPEPNRKQVDFQATHSAGNS